MMRHAAPVGASSHAQDDDPNEPCASCHREIYERYRDTPMAQASGPAADGLIPADFRDPASGIHYQVSEQDSRVWLSYDRDDRNRPLNGRQELMYFVGSGHRGRTYLFQRDGYWFEAPINWYAKKQIWDMAPDHQGDREMPLTMPVDPGCLHCHASAVASSLPDARNHYAALPFEERGITCGACHGDGAAHVSSGGNVHMLDIDALPPPRRDSVCLTCHLEGQVSVERQGKHPETFKPGDDLSDFTVFFVHRDETGSGGRATSQWKALLKSQCKLKSGDKMTCTTCHDPHGSPAPEERVSFFRQRCLQCHNQAGFAEKHHPENLDCTTCHMARPVSNDIAHEQVTDHWIRKRVSQQRLPLIQTGKLETVGGVPAGDRDFGLAYAQAAARGDADAGVLAMQLLRNAEKSPAASSDDQLHAQLGFLEQLDNEPDRAAEEYRMALSSNPFDSLAGGNLALIDAQKHSYPEAIRLWSAVFEHDPVQLSAGMNLAIVQCRLGQRDEALRTLNRILDFSPDDQQARGALRQIAAGQTPCASR